MKGYELERALEQDGLTQRLRERLSERQAIVMARDILEQAEEQFQE
jgi:hypothetical protein